MALQAVIGTPFTFEVLFVDGTNTPIAVNNPLISVFTFTSTGVKQTLVSAPLVAATPVEVGRYTYTYAVPTSFQDGDSLYGEMTGEDPLSLLTLRAEQQVVTISETRGRGCCCGLVARFVNS